MSDKPLATRNEPQCDAIATRFGIHLNVFVQAGREQPVDGAGYLMEIQWLTDLNKLRVLEIPRIDGLPFRILLD